jgi:acetyl esterase/lipase
MTIMPRIPHIANDVPGDPAHGGRLDTGNRACAIRRIDSLVYGSPGGRPLLADLYLPDDGNGPWPVIVWLHGGGWRFGDRRLAPDLSRHFASRGFAMASIDYRLTTDAIFPAQIEDVKTAVRWLRASAAQYGLDAERIGLWGSSAGGHLAALAATSGPGVFEDASSERGGESSEVQAVVEGYGPIDFLQMDAHRDPSDRPSDDPESIELPRGTRSANPESFESLLVGGPIERCTDRVQRANPITYARPGVPPFLILHGLCDTAVPAHQSEILFDALASRGVDVTLCLAEALGHGFLHGDRLGHQPPGRTVTRRAAGGAVETIPDAPPITFEVIESFFARHLRADAGAPSLGFGL